jgi:hypothetical protein
MPSHSIGISMTPIPLSSRCLFLQTHHQSQVLTTSQSPQNLTSDVRLIFVRTRFRGNGGSRRVIPLAFCCSFFLACGHFHGRCDHEDKPSCSFIERGKSTTGLSMLDILFFDRQSHYYSSWFLHWILFFGTHHQRVNRLQYHTGKRKR